jgi:hypothetical protein
VTEQSTSPAPSSLDNIKPYLAELLELRAAKAKIDARLKELDPIVRPAIIGAGSLQHAGYIFKCTMKKGAVSLDKALVTAYLEKRGKKYEDFTKTGSPSSVMTVSEIPKEA